MCETNKKTEEIAKNCKQDKKSSRKRSEKYRLFMYRIFGNELVKNRSVHFDNVAFAFCTMYKSIDREKERLLAKKAQ